MNLILLERTEIDGERAEIAGPRARHVFDVLRGQEGGSVRIGIVDGPRGLGVIEKLSKDRLALRCEWDGETPPVPPIDLLLALPRPKVLKRLWAQLAALGIGRIALVNAEKVERSYFDTHWLDEKFYRQLLVEGLQQAQDTRLPKVTIHRQLKPLVEDRLDELFPDTVRLLANPGAAAPISDVISSGRKERALVAVGPEGGWTDYEREMFFSRGFAPCGIGPRTLRTDTACIAILAQAYAAIGR